MEQPPKSLRINGRKVPIKYMRGDGLPSTAVGLFRSLTASIEISTDQGLGELKDTVLHEALHAILHTQGREYEGEVEELFVRAIATGLYGVFQDNPKFALWLSQSPPTSKPSPKGE